MTPSDAHLATAHLDSEPPACAERVRAGRHALVSDEPAQLGGGDAGPAPYQLLVSALAARTSITLRMLREHDEERVERATTLLRGTKIVTQLA